MLHLSGTRSYVSNRTIACFVFESNEETKRNATGTCMPQRVHFETEIDTPGCPESNSRPCSDVTKAYRYCKYVIIFGKNRKFVLFLPIRTSWTIINLPLVTV